MTVNTSDAAIRDILDFWLLPLSDPGYGKPREFWWKGTPELDAEIRAKFGALLEKAATGALDHWAKSADGALALIILCDQFSRNIHRKTAQAFATDPKARAIARLSLARSFPASFPPDARLFFFMPFGHSETLADQDLACSLFTTIADEKENESAIEHRDVVARFGRFPHRNEVLGRTCTEEELEYLKDAKRYGQ